MIFDTHAHYDSSEFAEDCDAVLSAMAENGVGTVVNVCADLSSLETTPALAEKYPFVYAAVGIHPEAVEEMTEDTLEKLRQLAKNKKVVAIGEIGLDYYWEENPPKDVQKEWFRKQLLLAREVELPWVIHSRDAAEDTMAILKEMPTYPGCGEIHCYSYSAEMAKEFIKMGYYIGVGGVVTYKNGRKLKETVEVTPMDRILLETDCPYLSPVPFRGKRNDSSNLQYVAEEIAQIKGVSKEEVIRITEENARRFFKIEA